VQLGAEVTLVDRDGVGGMCVLADCVPSKTFIATSEAMTTLSQADRVGVHGEGTVTVQVAEVHARVKALALAQSNDIASNLVRHGVSILHGSARLLPGRKVLVGAQTITADVVLLATGARPRRRARWRADPRLAPSLRPARAALPPRRRGLGRHRCGVRQRLPRDGLPGHARQLP
jgi:pyruvate/2-oxoglutarate dehydrogenase complex dihydrolipoamide dehydrogenase (E3) component